MGNANDFKLPGYARVWVYQSSRFFTPEEVKFLEEKSSDFVKGWNTHGTSLSAEIKILHNLFVIVAVDEMVAKASGCSIDKSVRLIKDMENALNISLTGRTTIAYVDADKKISLIHFNDLKDKVAQGNIDANLDMFNNLVSSLDDLNNGWIVPIKDSWLAKIPV